MLNLKYALLALAVLFVWQLLPSKASTAQKCSRLIKTPSGEQLLNTCGSCRIVKVQRKRPGICPFAGPAVPGFFPTRLAVQALPMARKPAPRHPLK
jgi:hypothetical protein